MQKFNLTIITSLGSTFAHDTKSHIIFSQVTLHRLPVLKEDEVLEDEIGHEEISIYIINGDDNWTVAQKKKK